MHSATGVLILAPRLETIGGVENYYNVLKLHRKDSRIEYFAVTGPSKESRLQLPVRLARNYWSFWTLLRTGRFGLVILNPTLDSRSFFRDSVFCWLAHSCNVSTLVFFRGWDVAMEKRIRNPGLARRVFAATFAKGRHFVVLGEIFRQRLLSLGCSVNSRFWVETTVADTRYIGGFSMAARLNRGQRFRMLFLGRLTQSKGPWRAIEAIQEAQSRRPDLQLELVIAGTGPELSKLEDYVVNRGLHTVKVIGPVRDKAKADLLNASDLLLFPTSAAEGMPNAVLEAMLYGIPVLATAVGAIPEVIEHGVNGYVADSPDPLVFAEWMIKLATDHHTWANMARRNHETALLRFTNAAVQARIKAIIDTCLDAAVKRVNAS